MIVYKDMAFCSDSDDCRMRVGCERFYGYEEREKAVKWLGSSDVPVMFMSFAGSCERRKESVAP